MSKRLRKGDKVIVITGIEKGKTGKVISCDGERILIEGINVRKKHMKKKQENQRSQIIDIECPIHVSNVSFCVDDKPFKLRARENKKGDKEFYYVDGGKEILYRSAKSAPV